MTVYVVGGSNSLMKTGWVSRFRAHEPDLVNLSVGATTSITGLFRVMTTPEIGPGDVVVWEYALNEANHLHRGDPPHVLLAHVEHFLRHLRERDIAVAPVLFMPRWLEQRAAPSPYKASLLSLFSHHGLKPFDMSAEYRAALGVARLPKAAFLDRAHYAHTDEVLGFICQGVSRAVREARVPAPTRPRLTRGEVLTLVAGFASETFENSIMRVPVARLPIRFTLPRAGQVAAVTFLTGADKDAFEVIVAQKRRRRPVGFSAARKEKGKGTLLKSALVPPNRMGPIAAAAGRVVRIEPWQGKGKLVAAYGCRNKIAAPSPEPQVRIAGVFLLSRPWWRRFPDLVWRARRPFARLKRRKRR